MEINDAIAQLAAKLDDWFHGSTEAFASQDRPAQGAAILRGVKIVKELDQLKAKGLAALKRLLSPRDTVTEQKRISSLIQGLEFGAKLAGALHDKLLDTSGQAKVVRLMFAIVKALDAIDPSRDALRTLLDNADPGVRGYAAAHLIDSMPELVIPILREIMEKEDANCAHFNAYFTLLIWEHEGKHAAANK